jgi:diguanylate cyclase (GGDEF)-like protein
VNTAIRWFTVSLYCTLSLFLLAFQNRPDNGSTLALNAVLCTVYLGSCINFLFTYRRATTGAFITIAGFLAWSLVFVVSPAMGAFLPHIQLESEVWNLPKYVVAVGMILLMLENQIEHNKYLALHDELTALPNRRLFQDRLANALERARRTGTQTALLLVDLNRFKEVNDTLGHHAGDRLLKHVATVFSGRVRRSDTVARTGGDEFSLILEEPTSRDEAAKVGSSLLEILKQPLQLGGHSVQISASIGIAVFPEDASDMESLCIAADRRMYSQKYGDANWNADPASTSPASSPELEAPDTGFQAAH